MQRNSPDQPRVAGFSLVEIVIVLLIVGVLAVLIVNSLQAVQAKSRDTTRRDDIDSIARLLEACYTNKETCNGAYPSLIQLTDTAPNGFVTTNMQGFNNDWLKDSSNGPIQSGDASAATQYQYTVVPNGCNGARGNNICRGFTLRAYQETNPDHPYVKESLNK